MRDVWGLLDEWGRSEDSRGRIKKALRLCPAAKLDSTDAVNELKEWLQAAFDSLVIFQSLPACVFVTWFCMNPCAALITCLACVEFIQLQPKLISMMLGYKMSKST